MPEPTCATARAHETVDRDEPLPAGLVALVCADCDHPHRTTRPICAECASPRLVVSMYCSLPRNDSLASPTSVGTLLALAVGLVVVAFVLGNAIAIRNTWGTAIVVEALILGAIGLFGIHLRRHPEARARWQRRARRWGESLGWAILFPSTILGLLLTAMLIGFRDSTRPYSAIPLAALVGVIGFAAWLTKHGGGSLLAPFRRFVPRRAGWQAAPIRGRVPVPLSEIDEIVQAHPRDPRCLHFVAVDGWIGDVEIRETAENARRITDALREIVRRQRPKRRE